MIRFNLVLKKIQLNRFVHFYQFSNLYYANTLNFAYNSISFNLVLLTFNLIQFSNSIRKFSLSVPGRCGFAFFQFSKVREKPNKKNEMFIYIQSEEQPDKSHNKPI